MSHKHLFKASLAACLIVIVISGNRLLAKTDNTTATFQPPPANLTIYTNGKIYSSDRSGFATDMAVQDGVIVAIGGASDIRVFRNPFVQTVDLQGHLVLPGFHDSHVHILEANSPLSGTCLVEPGRRPSRLVQSLKDCAPNQPIIQWVLGWGWDITTFMDSGENPLQYIDQAIPDRPAAIMEETSHAVWVNSLALDALGINAQTPDPPGGHIAKDQNGQPNGLLIDNAGDLAFEAALLRTPEVDEQHYLGLLNGLDQLAENGITTFADARVYWTRGYHEFYAQAELEGKLTARAFLGLWGYPQKPDEDQLLELANLYSAAPDQLVQSTQIKVYIDGITHMTTARTLSPYLVDYGFDTPMGLNYFDEDRLALYISTLEPLGFSFHIHALGAGGVREALNAIERAREINPESTVRHRLTHVEHVHPEDLVRFKALGVTADIQLAGDWTAPARFEAANAPFIGDDNPSLPLPARALIDSGANVTLSSDFDVSTLNPFGGIENAVTRGTESLTVREAVDAYAVNAAYSMGHEASVGTLSVGKKADFIVLDQDIFSTPLEQISETQVLLTVFDGKPVFRSEKMGCQSRLEKRTRSGSRENVLQRAACDTDGRGNNPET